MSPAEGKLRWSEGCWAILFASGQKGATESGRNLHSTCGFEEPGTKAYARRRKEALWTLKILSAWQ